MTIGGPDVQGTGLSVSTWTEMTGACEDPLWNHLDTHKLLDILLLGEKAPDSKLNFDADKITFVKAET